MASISQSTPVPLRATDSPLSTSCCGKRKYREGETDVALSALTGLKAESATKPIKITCTPLVGSSLRVGGIAEKSESIGPKPKASAEALVEDFDDDSSDDGFGEFDDPSYQSCIVRESRAVDTEAESVSRASSTTTFTFPPLVSDRSTSSSDSGSSRKPFISLSIEKVAKASQDKEIRFFQEFRVVSGSFPKELAPLLPSAFASGRVTPSSAGINGSCRIFDEKGDCIAIFKPREGEIGFRSSAERETKYLRCKEGLKPGEGALSEYISFRVNQMIHLIEIPSTCYVKVSSKDHSVKKEGSLHEFIPGARNYTDIAEREKDLLSKEQVEALAIYDLFIFNADRNEENILVVNKPEGGLELIGIDHGCILPRSAQSGGVFCWRGLQQVNSPMSAKARDIIESLSSRPLMALREELQTEGFEDVSMENFSERLLTHEASIHMLKHGARLGLSLAEIALFFQDCPPAINPLHKIITSSQKKAKSEKAVIIEIQTQIENLINTYLKVRDACKIDPSIERKDLGNIAAEKAIIILGLQAF